MLHPGSRTDFDFVKLRITIRTGHECRPQSAMTADDSRASIGD